MANVVNIHYQEGESASDILLRLMGQRKKDKNVGKSFVYYIQEFTEADRTDNSGRDIGCRNLKIPRNEIDRLSRDFASYGAKADQFSAYCNALEARLGIPAISLPAKIKYVCEVRPVDEIAERLTKYRKRAKYELKNLRAIYSEISESQNPKTLGALVSLNWLFNIGKKRTGEEICNRLFALIIKRERDRLFHSQRHPTQVTLHKCQDQELMERIKTLKWSINDKNPFEGALNHGGSCQTF